jgi:hypothetical protein
MSCVAMSHIRDGPALEDMFDKIRIACTLLFLTAGLTACLDVPEDTTSDTEQDLLYEIGTKPPSCLSACTETASCSTTCTDSLGLTTTCYDVDVCDPIEKKAREGRNPMTGETIQIPAKTTLKP